MTKVKVCGITNLEDALLSAKFGTDALGFNFYEKSPRYISPEKAREIIDQLPNEILKVGVFVNENLEKIIEISETAKLDAIQLHGEETPDFIDGLKQKTDLEVIKAFRVSPEFKSENVLEYKADAILLDAYNPKEHGGTGETFDWKIAKKVQKIFPKMYLAGGINLENVSYVTNNIKPFYIDICSGIEKEKGRKDNYKTINFLKVANYENKEIENIYEYCWAKHPNLTGFRFRFEKLSQLKNSIDSFSSGLFYASRKSDFKVEPFFSKFYKSRIDKVTGAVDKSLPENHPSFEEFVRNKYICGHKHFSWDELIVENNGKDALEALYTFYAFLEEYRIDFDN